MKKKRESKQEQESIPESGGNSEVSFLASPNTEVGDFIRNELGQFLSGNPGRPKRFNNAKDLSDAIVAYFEFCEKNKKPLTMTGLTLALGFRSRKALLVYEKEDGYEFAHDIIQYAKLKIEEFTEQRLHDPRANVVGSIFSLKNNFENWADKQEIKMDQRSMQLVGFNFSRPKPNNNEIAD